MVLKGSILPFSGPGAGALHVESDRHLQTEDVLVLPGPILVVSMREELNTSPPISTSFAFDGFLLHGVFPTTG